MHSTCGRALSDGRKLGPEPVTLYSENPCACHHSRESLQFRLLLNLCLEIAVTVSGSGFGAIRWPTHLGHEVLA